MSRVLIIGAHGLGDCLMSLQTAEWLSRHNVVNHVAISARNEIFQPLSYLFKDKYFLENIDPSYSENNALLQSDILPIELTKGYDDIYYVIPDLLFNNKKYQFPYNKYQTDPQSIRSIKLLHDPTPREKLVYLALNSTTQGYSYPKTAELVTALAARLPDYKFHLPILNTWNNQQVPKIEWDSPLCPKNLDWVINPLFIRELDIMKKSCYVVCLDNGPSHLAWHMGIPRLLLDPQYNKLPWIARWREDYTESIPLHTNINSIVELVEINLRIPQTLMIPRTLALLNNGIDWKNNLFLKEL